MKQPLPARREATGGDGEPIVGVRRFLTFAWISLAVGTVIGLFVQANLESLNQDPWLALTAGVLSLPAAISLWLLWVDLAKHHWVKLLAVPLLLLVWPAAFVLSLLVLPTIYLMYLTYACLARRVPN
jgi:hypothetical protein